MLNRYVNGYVLPKSDRAGHLINFFIRTYLPRILESSKTKGSRYIVTAQILSQPFLLNVIAFKALQNLKVKPDVVLTAAADGIPVAQALANLLGVRFVYAKLTQEFAFCDHYASKNATSRPHSFALLPSEIPSEEKRERAYSRRRNTGRRHL